MNTVKRAADSLPAAAMMALVEGRIVEAIRAVREAEDLGFREAKKIVERYIMCDAALRAQWVARREASRQVLGRIVRVMLLLLAGYVLYRVFKPCGAEVAPTTALRSNAARVSVSAFG